MFSCCCMLGGKRSSIHWIQWLLKSARLKGTFPMYESMKCQNFNPEENHIVRNKKLFISATCGEIAISKILYEFQKGNCIFATAA